MQNLFAHTDLGHDYPAVLSITKDDDGRHRVTVRSAGNGGRDQGVIHVSPEVLEHMATDVLAAINGETPAPATNFNEAIDAHYKAMVDRFLCWKLPQDFGPDCHVHFDREAAAAFVESWPVGTNLLTADQAKQMFMHCVDLPATLTSIGVIDANGDIYPEPPEPGTVVYAREESADHQCCGKCHAEPEPEAIDWRARYLRDVEGLNNEGDPIGGEPAMGLRQVAEHQRAVIQDLAQRLQTADYVILALLIKAGGEVVVTPEDCGKVPGNVVTNEVSEDKSTFTFRAVAAPQQVAQ